MKRLVFDPLEMRDSSYVWQARFDADYAEPYDSALRQGIKPKYHAPKAAWSLGTTATDYAKFLQAVLAGTSLRKETAQQWLTPQVKLSRQCGQCLDGDEKALTVNVAWGLGWGLEPDQGMFFHWGDNDQFKAFVIGSVRDRSAVIVFTNGTAGLSIMPDLIGSLTPGDHPAFTWLGYERYDSSARRLIHASLKNGIEAAWARQDQGALDEKTRRLIATELSERGQDDDALWLRRRNAVDYPRSAQCHFDLGESDLKSARMEDALAEFKRTMELDPKRSRTASLVKLLEAKAFPLPMQTGRTELHLAGFPNAQRIAAVGTFNAWETASLPMRRTSDGWSVKTDLPPGSYLYAFSVDGTLIPDPANPQHTTANPESASVLKVDAANKTP